ncbi:MAG: thioredoxin-disulfide reductase [Spirochaetales bacterium]|nr:thioredoxin-disulfide reductase [Spirochaetales bacterium]
MADWDLIIIGAGPAGLAAAQYGSRANLKCVIVEEMAPGGQALTIDDLENYPGFPKGVNGFQFSDDMRAQAEKFGAEFKSASVKEIVKEGEDFVVKTARDEIKAPALIFATGAKHRHLGAPGEEEFAGKGVSYCATCDGPFFKGKKILVVGGGDAACDEAVYLSKLSDQVKIIHRRDRFRAQKAVADRVINDPNIEVNFNTTCEEIKGEMKVNKVVLKDTVTGELREEEMDAVFIFVGTIPQTQIAPDVDLDDMGYIKTNEKMETSLPGFYAVGDVRDTPFRQVITACADGAVAAHVASNYIDELRGQAYGK